MTRRDFIGSNAVAVAAGGRIALANRNQRLEFDSRTGQLLSLRAAGGEHELIAAGERHPVFVIQYLEGKSFRQILSSDAREIQVRQQGNELRARFGAKHFDAEVTVRMDEPFSRWSISVRNHAGLRITDVQFPFVVLQYGAGGEEALLQPWNGGRLIRAPRPQDLEKDTPIAWQFRPENHDTWHYPGLTFAQFLAYCATDAGVYLACEDPTGAVKLIKPVHHDPGLRLGIAHVGDWPEQGERKLEYDVVLRTFSGDWYEAAGIYREWALKQAWAQKPLAARNDMPPWLMESPPHIMVRIQGQLDDGPAPPNAEFLPYRKIVDVLEPLAKQIEAPLVPVIMSWERPGPWIYPDCFPPAGGDDSVREFTELARERGWHVGTFCNGTRWVTAHFLSGYNGEAYFKEHQGERTVSRTHDGELWKEDWDRTWRPSYAACMAVERTRGIADDFMRRVLGWGLDWVQFLDQNVGAATFPCFASDHGHPPMPGRWMNDAMRTLLDGFHALARETKRPIAISVECPANEFVLPRFHICDVRAIPPGHPNYERQFVPLYSFLYHEFILIQGGFGFGQEPYHMPIRNAYNLVVGQIPGGVVTGDGRLLNRDTINWAPWKPQVGSNEDSVAMLKATTALRRGAGKAYLVFGRMQRPLSDFHPRIMTWKHADRAHRAPAVFEAVWRSPRGGTAAVLANWTKEPQTVAVTDERFRGRLRETTSASAIHSTERTASAQGLEVELPPLSCVLLEKV